VDSPHLHRPDGFLMYLGGTTNPQLSRLSPAPVLHLSCRSLVIFLTLFRFARTFSSFFFFHFLSLLMCSRSHHICLFVCFILIFPTPKGYVDFLQKKPAAAPACEPQQKKSPAPSVRCAHVSGYGSHHICFVVCLEIEIDSLLIVKSPKVVL
jgi:hypothetical protein